MFGSEKSKDIFFMTSMICDDFFLFIPLIFTILQFVKAMFVARSGKTRGLSGHILLI